MNEQPASDRILASAQSTGITDQILRWLAEQALESTSIEPLFAGLCERIHRAGLPIERTRVTWPSFHPMFQAEQLVWNRGEPVFHESFDGSGVNDESWTRSSLRFLLDSDVDFLRRHLTGPKAMVDFPNLEELVTEGMTDYFAAKTYFSIPRVGDGSTGILVSWATKRPDGFAEEELGVLTTLQQEFAVAFRGCVQNDVMRTIGRVYLGPTAASRVLSGQIRRGDGQQIDAAIWISDLRNSTALSEAMPLADYLGLLDTYFECTGGAVLEQGGEILDFVGDSVIAIFPLEQENATLRATRAAIHAHENRLRA
jgi:adenylate cyclase